jgi:hypothetical protein
MAMSLPPDLKKTVDEALAGFCRRGAAPRAQGGMRLVHQWRGSSVTLLEQRPHGQEPGVWGQSPVAQFRFDALQGAWTLHWRDRNDRWRPYEEPAGARNIQRLLAEVGRDPDGIFWG